MQCWIQNGGRENAEYSGCLRCRLFCRYGCNDHAWYEELRNYEDRTLPSEPSGGSVFTSAPDPRRPEAKFLTRGKQKTDAKRVALVYNIKKIQGKSPSKEQ